MPITIDSEIKVFSESEFHAVAERIIGIGFGIHNSFGRLLDESCFKRILLRHCEAAYIVPIFREVRITVYHEDFLKHYYMDLLFAYGVMVEIKTVERLIPAHFGQTLNYLLLTGMQHGLLLNFRPGRMEKRFISSHLNLGKRRKYQIVDEDWIEIDAASWFLRTKMRDLLDDWGGFLQTTLYRNALIHFFGGELKVLHEVPILDTGSEVGRHQTFLISDGVAVAMTSLSENVRQMGDHLRRFLNHTRLRYVQWINLNQHDVEFRTLVR